MNFTYCNNKMISAEVTLAVKDVLGGCLLISTTNVKIKTPNFYSSLRVG